jgi:hypothetical protein
VKDCLGALEIVRRAREQEAREALADTAAAAARAREEEDGALRRLQDVAAQLRATALPDVGPRSAEELQLRGRRAARLGARLEASVAVRLRAGEERARREAVAGRAREELAAARRAREQVEERCRLARAEQSARRERAEEESIQEQRGAGGPTERDAP